MQLTDSPLERWRPADNSWGELCLTGQDLLGPSAEESTVSAPPPQGARLHRLDTGATVRFEFEERGLVTAKPNSGSWLESGIAVRV